MGKKFKTISEFNSYKIEETDDHVELRVGLGSCGIAAGAGRVYNIFEKEIANRGLSNIKIKKVGCLGLCFSEPNVEVKVPGLPSVLYGQVDEKFAKRIIEEHIGEKIIINENIYDKPYIDVFDIK